MKNSIVVSGVLLALGAVSLAAPAIAETTLVAAKLDTKDEVIAARVSRVSKTSVLPGYALVVVEGISNHYWQYKSFYTQDLGTLAKNDTVYVSGNQLFADAETSTAIGEDYATVSAAYFAARRAEIASSSRVETSSTIETRETIIVEPAPVRVAQPAPTPAATPAPVRALW